MPLYIGDYLSDTMHLSAEEHGAYLLLIMHYWRNGPIRDDDATLLTVARIKPSRVSTKILSTVRSFFQTKNGYLVHARIDKELVDALEKKEQKQNQTSSARQAKSGKTSSVTNTVTDIVTEDVTDSPSPSPSPLGTETPLTDSQSVGKRGVEKNKKGFNKFDVTLYFTDSVIEAARRAAPGWDIYYLANVYNAGVETRGRPKLPGKAFPAWCAKYTKGREP
ncbi:MAG: DUF1376 domain-containing protein [Candidatus Saccharibacteria bacterium]|nr:DUF1376 domain-containing protein [Candidatus Saccharibacteria bacterium]